jgi:hypothetical protein
LKIQTGFTMGIYLLSDIVHSPLHYDHNYFKAYSLLSPRSNEGSIYGYISSYELVKYEGLHTDSP